MELEQKLKKLELACKNLEEAKNLTSEAGKLVNEVDGLATGVVGNPFREVISALSYEEMQISGCAKILRIHPEIKINNQMALEHLNDSQGNKGTVSES